MTALSDSWLKRLSGKLADRQTKMSMFDDYYTGDHPLPFLTRAHDSKMRNEFRKMLEDSRSNFMRLVVDVTEERLKVEGFRLSASSDQATDKATWDIWQANQLDSESQVAFVESLVKGVSYMSVWTAEEEGEHPTICVEDPMQTIVAYVPGTGYRQRAAALKVWRDEDMGVRRANVYLPEGIYKYEAKIGKESSVGDPRNLEAPGDQDPWSEIPGSFVPNLVGVVPIVPIRNRPRLLVEGESELADVFRIQNQINGFLFLLALAGYMGAHRQRWATGLKIMEDTAGNPVEPFNAAVDKIWQAENPEVKFGDFEQTQLSGYLESIEQKVQHVAVTTRTPKHYLLPAGQEPSGDAIKSAESGLVKKILRKQTVFGEGLEETMRLARRFAGEGDSPVDSEIVWADPEIRTEAEQTDAAAKKLQLGLIDRAQALEDLGYSQTQIARMMANPPEPPPSPNPDPEASPNGQVPEEVANLAGA